MTSISIYLQQIHTIAISNKYTKWYVSIILRANQRAQTKLAAKRILGYTEAHHILPKCFKKGGDYDKENLAFLTAREHFVCHWLLTKMFTEPSFKRLMGFALTRFHQNNKNQRRNLSSIEFDVLRRNSAILSSVKGWHHSEDAKMKMREYAFNRTTEHQEKINLALTGRIVNIDTRNKISKSNLGKPKSDEFKNKMKSLMQKPQNIVTCPYCNKTGGVSNLTRYHFDNCKLKN